MIVNSRLVVSMAAHLVRAGVPHNEREAIRNLADRYGAGVDVAELAGQALALAREAGAGADAARAATHRLVDGPIVAPQLVRR